MAKTKLDARTAEGQIENLAECCFLPAFQKLLERTYSYQITSDDLAIEVLEQLARVNAQFRRDDESAKGVALGLVEARKEAIEGLRRLAKLRFGRFVVGRRGSKTRLELSREGRDVLRKHFEIEDPVPQSTHEGPASVNASSDANNGEATIAHQFVLRPDVLVRLSLPADLSANEAARLARFVESLPFSESAP
jgi:hypothetical protein